MPHVHQIIKTRVYDDSGWGHIPCIYPSIYGTRINGAVALLAFRICFDIFPLLIRRPSVSISSVPISTVPLPPPAWSPSGGPGQRRTCMTCMRHSTRRARITHRTLVRVLYDLPLASAPLVRHSARSSPRLHRGYRGDRRHGGRRGPLQETWL